MDKYQITPEMVSDFLRTKGQKWDFANECLGAKINIKSKSEREELFEDIKDGYTSVVIGTKAHAYTTKLLVRPFEFYEIGEAVNKKGIAKIDGWNDYMANIYGVDYINDNIRYLRTLIKNEVMLRNGRTEEIFEKCVSSKTDKNCIDDYSLKDLIMYINNADRAIKPLEAEIARLGEVFNRITDNAFDRNEEK